MISLTFVSRGNDNIDASLSFTMITKKKKKIKTLGDRNIGYLEVDLN